MKKILLKDIIIPAGTIFTEASRKTTRRGGHFSHTIGLTKDSSGDLTYYVDPDDNDLGEFFTSEEVHGSGKKCPAAALIECGQWNHGNFPLTTYVADLCGDCNYVPICKTNPTDK